MGGRGRGNRLPPVMRQILGCRENMVASGVDSGGGAWRLIAAYRGGGSGEGWRCGGEVGGEVELVLCWCLCLPKGTMSSLFTPHPDKRMLEGRDVGVQLALSSDRWGGIFRRRDHEQLPRICTTLKRNTSCICM